MLALHLDRPQTPQAHENQNAPHLHVYGRYIIAAKQVFVVVHMSRQCRSQQKNYCRNKKIPPKVFIPNMSLWNSTGALLFIQWLNSLPLIKWCKIHQLTHTLKVCVDLMPSCQKWLHTHAFSTACKS